MRRPHPQRSMLEKHQPRPVRAPVVAVVEDDPVSRTYLLRLAERSGHEVRAHATAEEFLAALDPKRPTCVLLDLSLPGMGGAECLERIAALEPMPAVVVVTGTADVSGAVRLLRMGALDLLEKPADDAQVLAAIQSGVAQSQARHQAAEQRRSALSRIGTLSPRELEVFSMVTRGAMNKQVAQELGIAAKTVEVHRANVMRKLGVDSLAHLVRLAVDAGIGGASASNGEPPDAVPPRDPAPGRRFGTQAGSEVVV